MVLMMPIKGRKEEIHVYTRRYPRMERRDGVGGLGG
jgi:hypothetical protein